jgi:predicted phage terminase large subunit-like protein
LTTFSLALRKAWQSSYQLSDDTPKHEPIELVNARRNLLDFTLYTYPGYRVNWHHELLCSYLDRFANGEIKRLIVAMPPRHGKSELVSIRLPAFIFGRDPDAHFIGASYGADLARHFNRDVQRVIDSPAYRQVFPETRLFDSNVRTTAQGTWLRNSDNFEIVGHKGMYKCAGVGGGLTGFGFKYGSIDDPFKDAAEANSQTIRQNKWEWYTDVFYTRQAPDAGILVTMTRWNMDDTVGRLKEAMQQIDGEQWEVLELPAIMEDVANKHPQDPRELGEPLWADRFNLDFLEKAKAQNSYSFSALYQQKPIPHGDALFNPDLIDVIDYLPECTETVRFYDLAVTAKKHSDYTVGLKMGITKTEELIILDVYRVQKTMPDVEIAIAQNAAIDGKPTRIRLEAEKAGIVQLDYLLQRADLRGYTLDKKAPEGDKYTRAQPFASRVNAGKVKMVRGAWNRAYLDELAVFPMGAHDDQVDASSGAYDMLVLDQVTISVGRYA